MSRCNHLSGVGTVEAWSFDKGAPNEEENDEEEEEEGEEGEEGEEEEEESTELEIIIFNVSQTLPYLGW